MVQALDLGVAAMCPSFVSLPVPAGRLAAERFRPIEMAAHTRHEPMQRRTLAVVSGLVVLFSLPVVGRPARAQSPGVPPPAGKLDRIRPSDDRTHFVREGTNERVVLWGFNYDHDDAG